MKSIGSKKLRYAVAGVAVMSAGLGPAVGVVALVNLASPASAAAYTKNVYPPNKNGSKLDGWADLSLDPSGTVGCWNYMKIERKRFGWVEWINGGWVSNNGWNVMYATLPSGSWEYRTTVDSYNDIIGTNGAGVNIGPVGTTANGTRIYRFKTTWSSGWVRHNR